MKRITQEELDEILRKHKLWLEDKPGGERAIIISSDLRGSNLSESDLRWSDLSESDLRWSDLSESDLRWSNLSGSILHGSNLSESDLRWSSIRGCILHGSNLSGSDLRGSIFSGSDLSGSDFSGSILSGSNFSECDLSNAKNFFVPLSCPEKGAFVGFKKCSGNLIVELLILEDAKRSSATGRKCRCDKAKVIGITKLDGTDAGVDNAKSNYDRTFVYKVGETVEVKNFDGNRWNECAPGIHFFITRKEAVDYQ